VCGAVYVNGTIGDIIETGRATLELDLAGHIAAGAGNGSTVEANSTALNRCKLISSVASGVGTPTTATSVLGFDLELPVLTAPMGPLELIDPSGARAVADGARRGGAATTVALTSAPILEDVIVPGVVALFQLYWWGDRDWVRSMILRAHQAGFAAVVITVDVPDYGTRWADVRSGFDHHGQMALPNLVDAPPERAQRLAFQQALTFEDIAWAVDASPLPIVLKGVLSAADTRHAINAGVDAIYVSNHGGRALAGQIGTMDALEEVVVEASGEVPIVVDGGFSTAEDVATGLACGADLVAIGRPMAYALAEGGADGVANYLSLLKHDLQTALTVLGASSPAALGRMHVRRT
jgi:isopentenyl diphosphate isomerase/L-lactate dehydrogenase-like FMN-dependent dehydrogenase